MRLFLACFSFLIAFTFVNEALAQQNRRQSYVYNQGYNFRNNNYNQRPPVSYPMSYPRNNFQMPNYGGQPVTQHMINGGKVIYQNRAAFTAPAMFAGGQLAIRHGGMVARQTGAMVVRRSVAASPYAAGGAVLMYNAYGLATEPVRNQTTPMMVRGGQRTCRQAITDSYGRTFIKTFAC